MKNVVLLIALFITIHSAFSQDIEIEYIESFDKIENCQEISFRETINSFGNLMTCQEALDYVYSGDTTRLYCVHMIFNMETEKVIDISKELTLPRKYFYIEYKDYYVIANSSYLCQNENELSQVFLNLHVISRDLELMSSTVVYSGNEYDEELQGLINPASGKIFITGFKKGMGKYAKLLEVNQESLKFEVIVERFNIEVGSENWKRELEELGWYGSFMVE